MTDELSFAPKSPAQLAGVESFEQHGAVWRNDFAPSPDRQTLRREIALALLLQSFPSVLSQVCDDSPIDSTRTLIAACWKIADRFLEVGERS